MQLEHQFSVPVGVNDAWRILLDARRVAACIPGATLESVDGDVLGGAIKVKLGPIGATYRGTATISHRDPEARRFVLDAAGDSRTNGSVSAHAFITMIEFGGTTSVVLVADLEFTGKAAELEYAVVNEAGARLVRQFAQRLADAIAAPQLRTPAPATTKPASIDADAHAAPERIPEDEPAQAEPVQEAAPAPMPAAEPDEQQTPATDAEQPADPQPATVVDAAEASTAASATPNDEQPSPAGPISAPEHDAAAPSPALPDETPAAEQSPASEPAPVRRRPSPRPRPVPTLTDEPAPVPTAGRAFTPPAHAGRIAAARQPEDQPSASRGIDKRIVAVAALVFLLLLRRLRNRGES